ncbi:peptide chain release factor N(5)-glutamine methyltransferase [Tianweitania sp. BSSL-BM11]|uniref:Release factor glutamine methyltransferase n=1 Tax=Tianweitania aestuarii TaxID=2814886 RepID=A0ABS5RZD2_9HYPH|nr:peptide chain release factor N(5)-glutamine methyltransferase [Tianweitania aestuarii]MBS9722419.1 peptide chain release factor N(5)-glutamine methyltransferase [Tianweitania aestuarii]
MTSASQALRMVRDALRSARIEGADFDARLLFEHVTGLSALDLVRDPHHVLTQEQLAALEAAQTRRIGGEPVHRILGYRDFHGLRFNLSPDTLEPRPDTEILVDAVAPWLRTRLTAAGSCQVLDLGTGSGAIAVSLLKEVAGLKAVATDLSAGALQTASGNARINGVADRFETVRSDWLADVTGRFDAIVSNPPYIASAVIADLSRDVRDHDPMRALDGGTDGLDAYRAIAEGAERSLAPDGIIGLEIGWDQKTLVSALFERAGYRLIDARKDYGGNDRVLIFAFKQA